MATFLAFPGLQDPYLPEACRAFQNDVNELRNYYNRALIALMENRADDYRYLVPNVGPVLTALQHIDELPNNFLFIIGDEEKMHMRVEALTNRIAYIYKGKGVDAPSFATDTIEPLYIASYDGCVARVRDAVLKKVDKNRELIVLIGPGTPQCNFGALMLGFSMRKATYLQVLQPRERCEEAKLVKIAFDEVFERFGDVSAMREREIQMGALAPAEVDSLDVGIKVYMENSGERYLRSLLAEMSAVTIPTQGAVATRAGIDAKTLRDYLKKYKIEWPRERGRPAQ